MNTTLSLDGPVHGPRRIVSLPVLLLFNALGVALAVASDLAIYVPLVLLGLLVAVALARHLTLWLSVVILGHLALFLQRSTEISGPELVFGLVMFLYLSLFFADRIVVRRTSLLEDPGDRALVLFLLAGFFSFVPALMTRTDMGLWGREFLVLAGFLLYFPLREAIRTPLGRRIIVGSFVALAATIAVKNIVQYQQQFSVAQVAWELVSGRQTANEPFFMAMIVGTGVALGTAEHARGRLISLVGFVLFSFSLLVSFSRGYWMGTAIGLFVAFLLLRPAERRSMGWILALTMLSAIVCSWVILGDRFTTVIDIVSRRLLSAGDALADISFRARLAESKAVFGQIVNNPILGHGLGAEFAYYHPIRDVTYTNSYVHNAYLWLWFKLGAAGLVLFLAAYGTKLVSGIRLLRAGAPGRGMVIAAVALLIAMLVVSLTSPQFYARDSVLIIAICWALISQRLAEARRAE